MSAQKKPNTGFPVLTKPNALDLLVNDSGCLEVARIMTPAKAPIMQMISTLINFSLFNTYPSIEVQKGEVFTTIKVSIIGNSLTANTIAPYAIPPKIALTATNFL